MSRLVTVLVIVSLIVFPVHGGSRTSTLQLGDATELRYETADPGNVRPDTGFAVDTGYGELRGQASRVGDHFTLRLWLEGQPHDTLELSYLPGSADDGRHYLALDIPGTGRLLYTQADGQVVLYSSTVWDCSSISTNRVYLAVVETYERFVSMIGDGPALPLEALQIAVLIRFVAVAPTLETDCETYIGDLLVASCIIYDDFQKCSACCDKHETLGSAIWCSVLGTMAGLLPGGVATGVAVSIACSVFAPKGMCAARHCEGKPGDPTPNYCLDGSGMCKRVCRDPAHVNGNCEDGLVCCETEIF